MELKHREVAAERSKFFPRKAFVSVAVMAAGLVYFGTMHIAAHDNKPRAERFAQASGTSCESVFTTEAKRRIGSVVESAVSSKAEDIRESMGVNGTRTFLNVSVGVDRGGRLVIEDIWSYPEPARGIDASEILRGIRFEGMQLNAPNEGTRCSYTVPVDISRNI
jgi:hypothetical protein